MSCAYRMLGVSLAIVAGCATVPEPITVGPVQDIAPANAVDARVLGARVRWGGTILSVDAKPTETCFEVLGFALRYDGAPEVSSVPEGRFVACATGLDGSIDYRAKPWITVVGLVTKPEAIAVGDHWTDVPTVKVERVKLWSPRPPALTFYGEPWAGAWATPWYPFAW